MRKPSSGSRCGDEDRDDDDVFVDVVVYYIDDDVVVYDDDHAVLVYDDDHGVVVYDDGEHPCPNM